MSKELDESEFNVRMEIAGGFTVTTSNYVM